MSDKIKSNRMAVNFNEFSEIRQKSTDNIYNITSKLYCQEFLDTVLCEDDYGEETSEQILKYNFWDYDIIEDTYELIDYVEANKRYGDIRFLVPMNSIPSKYLKVDLEKFFRERGKI